MVLTITSRANDWMRREWAKGIECGDTIRAAMPVAIDNNAAVVFEDNARNGVRKLQPPLLDNRAIRTCSLTPFRDVGELSPAILVAKHAHGNNSNPSFSEAKGYSKAHLYAALSDRIVRSVR